MKGIFVFAVGCCAIIAVGECQLASLFDKAKKTQSCGEWSSWGDCIWLRTEKSTPTNLYLDQISDACKSHWFFRWIRQNWGTALNNFFTYLQTVTRNREPCGMCSYRQSCGAYGSEQCHIDPISHGRTVLPFYVAEQVCSVRQGRLSRPQDKACIADRALLARNGGECQMWPNRDVELPGLSDEMKETLYNLKWSNCVLDRRTNMCRCCCFPFAPNPTTFVCEHMGQEFPNAPGQKN